MRAFPNLTDEEFRALPPEIKKSCGDCGHLHSAISWWCGSEEAIKARGTRIPGICNCPFWKPLPIKLSLWQQFKTIFK